MCFFCLFFFFCCCFFFFFFFFFFVFVYISWSCQHCLSHNTRNERNISPSCIMYIHNASCMYTVYYAWTRCIMHAQYVCTIYIMYVHYVLCMYTMNYVCRCHRLGILFWTTYSTQDITTWWWLSDDNNVHDNHWYIYEYTCIWNIFTITQHEHSKVSTLLTYVYMVNALQQWICFMHETIMSVRNDFLWKHIWDL